MRFLTRKQHFEGKFGLTEIGETAPLSICCMEDRKIEYPAFDSRRTAIDIRRYQSMFFFIPVMMISMGVAVGAMSLAICVRP
jgi:hypothetical protein